MSAIIGLYGGAGVGKDLFADYAESWVKREFDGAASCYRTSFAEPVYELAAVIFGVTPEKLGERSGKELDQWFSVHQHNLESARDLWNHWGLDKFIDFSDVWPKFFAEHVAELKPVCFQLEQDLPWKVPLFNVYTSPRWLLQRVGTELGRKMVYENVWLDLLKARVYKNSACLSIITDVRFNNEAKVIHEMPHMAQSLNVQIVSPTSPHQIKSNHVSESGVSEILLDKTFVNHFTGIENLCQDVNNFLDEELYFFI